MPIYQINSLSALNNFLNLSVHERSKLHKLEITQRYDDFRYSVSESDFDSDTFFMLSDDVKNNIKAMDNTHLNYMLYNLEESEFNLVLKSITQCTALQSVKLTTSLQELNPDRFKALGNTLATLKNVKINLCLESILNFEDEINIETLENILQWPIKSLKINNLNYVKLMDSDFCLKLALCPIQHLRLAEPFCFLSIIDCERLFENLRLFFATSKTVKSFSLSTYELIHPTYSEFTPDDSSRLKTIPFGPMMEQAAKKLEKLRFNKTWASLNDSDFELLCNTISQLKKLRSIDINWVSIGNDSRRFEMLFNALRKCPKLTEIKEKGKSEGNNLDHTPYDLAKRISNAELTLNSVGLSGNATTGGGALLLEARNTILTVMFQDNYRKYYQQGAFQFIAQYNQKRTEAPETTSENPLRISNR